MAFLFGLFMLGVAGAWLKALLIGLWMYRPHP